MQRHVEHVKDQLHQFYLDNYAKMPTPPPAIQPIVTETSGSPQKVNFTAQYKKHPSTVKDGLEEFYKLLQEDFDTCDPIQWWSGRCSQFPNLSRLAWEILAMPGEFTSTHLDLPTNYLAILLQGSAVAIECIFSGGCDTISLHHASLGAETIQTLMLVKQHLLLTCTAIDELLCN